MHHIDRLLQLREEMRFRCLIGVHLQAERIQSDLCQTFLYHRQRRHLLRYEQNTFSFEQSVGNHVRDGLRLTRSRRPVKDEALSFARLDHRFHLRGVHIQRYRIVGWFHFLVDLTGIYLLIFIFPLDASLHQTLDDRVLLQLICIRVDIVPHHKLIKREDTQ